MNDTAPPTGNAATQIVMLAGVTRDPALQCRAQLDEETVVRYVDVVDKLPAVRIIRDGDVDYLVDGWHRFEAHVRAGRSTIHALIDVGTRRDAILAAVQANSSHGLPRSNEDTRRAVKVLLMDGEWCALSDRAIAKLADVSHTHVAKMRYRYGVDKGEVLTAERANEVDGVLRPEWAALNPQSYDLTMFDAYRTAGTPAALAERLCKFGTHTNTARKAFELRAAELAAGEWPWAEGMSDGAVKIFLGGIDHEADLELAVGSARVTEPMRTALYMVLRDARRIDTIEAWRLPQLAIDWALRPALAAALQPRMEALEAEAAARPKPHWQVVDEVHAETNLLKQALLVGTVPKEVFAAIEPRKLLPVVRDGKYRDLVERGGDPSGHRTPAADCPVPGCGGWVTPHEYDWGRKCATCGQQPEEWRIATRKALSRVAKLLAHDGYGFMVDGILIDRRVVEAIAIVRSERAATIKLGGELGKAMRALVVQTPSAVMLVDPAKPEPDNVAEDEDDTDDDSVEGGDGDADDDLEDDDGGPDGE